MAGVQTNNEIRSILNKRKRKNRHQVETEEWAVNKNKSERERGKTYLDKKYIDGKWKYDIRKQGKSLKEKCSCERGETSVIKCGSISEEDREKIFHKFWKMSWEKKKVLAKGVSPAF